MTNHDRLAHYRARMDNAGYMRTLPDSCGGCRESVLSCNASKHIERAPCCSDCSHKQ